MKEKLKSLCLEDKFNFSCHKGVKCYRLCCRNVNIFLTPYDVIRLKQALKMTSGEFIQFYTDMIVIPKKIIPLVQFKMNKDDNYKCFLLYDQGCRYYYYRPWACRMYPLDEYILGGYKIIPSTENCYGLLQDKTWIVKDWLIDQGAIQSKEIDSSWDSLFNHLELNNLDINNEQIRQMIVTSLFDIDKFREFIFNSTFLERFELDNAIIKLIKTDDIALLDLSYAWVRFGLLGQRSLKIKNFTKK